MLEVPALRLGEFEFDPKGKPFLLVLPTGQSIGFTTAETASAYLSSARQTGLLKPDEGRLFHWTDERWFELV